MGEFANPLWIKILGWTTARIIIVLNVKLLLDTFLPDAVLKALYILFDCPLPNDDSQPVLTVKDSITLTWRSHVSPHSDPAREQSG